MKYCTHCGCELHDTTTICEKCGCPTKNVIIHDANTPEDLPSLGLNILGFLLPFIGLIMFIAIYNKSPNKAKSVGIWSLISFVLSVVILLIAI